MILYQFYLPFPVSVNQMYGGGSGQQRFISKKYKAWILSCPKLNPAQISEEISVEYIFEWPDKRKRDGNNYTKSVLDYIVKCGVILDDDYSIVAAESWRHMGVNKGLGRVEVIIRLLSSPDGSPDK
jgi:Holliday junction resolvase RusA-like endonuclease